MNMEGMFENIARKGSIANSHESGEGDSMDDLRQEDYIQRPETFEKRELDNGVKILTTLDDFLPDYDSLDVRSLVHSVSGKSELPPDHWFQIMSRIYERFGEEPNPMMIRAHRIIRALGIPSGQVSALASNQEAIREDKDADEIIAKQLTNTAGEELTPYRIPTSDILDIHPDKLPEGLANHLDPRMKEMFEIRYAYSSQLSQKEGERITFNEALRPEHYFRLPGGVDLLCVAYRHESTYQNEHEQYLERLSSRAAVVAIEGGTNLPYGESLESYWMLPELNKAYGPFMNRAYSAGFRGLFAEVDARDGSRIDFESLYPKSDFNRFFPRTFLKQYRKYLQKEHPELSKTFDSEDDLLMALKKMISREQHVTVLDSEKKRGYAHRLGIAEDGTYEPDFNGLEISQLYFSDALSAIKLHLIGRLMADGKIEKGPILDIQGLGHLTAKSFFIRYPEYAMEIVLRNLPELMAYRATFKTASIWKELKYPDWPKVVRQIAKLGFARTTDKSGEIEPFFYDYLGKYGIDPKKVIPSDKEIQEIIERTKRGEKMSGASRKE